MPYRNMETLQAWVTEFRDLGYPIAGSLRVIPQDGDDGADTGLVTVHLANASTPISVRPLDDGSRRWVATMEPREDVVELGSGRLLELSSELAMMSALCAFLETKSQAYPAADPA